VSPAPAPLETHVVYRLYSTNNAFPCKLIILIIMLLLMYVKFSSVFDDHKEKKGECPED
jgi:hypothetical protein